MLIDIPIGLFLIISALAGFRDGLLRKTVAIAVLAFALVLGQVFMHDVGDLLVEPVGINSSNAPIVGYLTIFISAAILQSLLYKIVTGGYKIGGIADRVIGAALGLIQGATFISGLLFILSMTDVISKETTADSRLYRPVVNLAPQILDLTATAGPAAIEKLKELEGAEKKKQQIKNAQQKADEEAREQNRMLEKARKALRKETEK